MAQLAVAGPGCHSFPFFFPAEWWASGEKGQVYSWPSYPRKHFSSTSKRKNHEANETCTSFPAMLSPTSGPEESPLGRHPNRSVWLSCVHASVQGKSSSDEHTGGNEVPLKITRCLEKWDKGRRRGWSRWENKDGPGMRVRSLAWNPGQLPALLELRYGLQTLLRAHLSPGGNLLNARPSDSCYFCDPPRTSCLAILGIKTLLQKYLFTGLAFFFPHWFYFLAPFLNLRSSSPFSAQMLTHKHTHTPHTRVQTGSHLGESKLPDSYWLCLPLA